MTARPTPRVPLIGDRTVPPSASRLPMEPHLTSADTFMESDPAGAGDVWARIVVPGPPYAVLRLGDAPNDAPEQQARTAADALRTSAGLPPAPSANGVLFFTDRNSVTSVVADGFTLTAGDALEVVAGTDMLQVGTAQSSSTETQSSENDEIVGLGVYAPANETFANFALPGFITAVPDPDAEAPPPTVVFADIHEVRGNHILRVNDLLTEYVRGDRASYTRGNEYEFVRGTYALVIDGSEDEMVMGNRERTTLGNNTTTTGSPDQRRTRATTVYGDTSTTINGESHSEVDGVRATTVYGSRVGVTLGASISLQLYGLRFDCDIGVRLEIVVSLYVRLFALRLTTFATKAEFVGLKAGYDLVKVSHAVKKHKLGLACAQKYGFLVKKHSVETKKTGVDVKSNDNAFELNDVTAHQ